MNFSNWQTIASLLCVLLAAAAMVRRSVRFFSGDGSSGCESCPSKSKSRVVTSERLITFDQITLPTTGEDAVRH